MMRWLSFFSALSVAASANQRHIFLCFVLVLLIGRPARAWQLQDGRPLAFAKICNKYNLAVREFQRIVMRGRAVEVHLPKPRDLVR